jgi:hypothetical protein
MLAKKWKHCLIRTCISLIPIIAWQGYISHVTSGEEYKHPAYEYQRAAYQFSNVSYFQNILLVDPFAPELGHVSTGGMAKRVAINLLAMPMSIGEATSANRGFWTWLFNGIQRRIGVVKLPQAIVGIIVAILGLLVMTGCAVMLIGQGRIVSLYIGASVLLISLTPWSVQFMRYLAPITPFLALALVKLLAMGRDYSRQHLSKKWQPAGTIILVLIVSMVLGVELFATERSYRVRRTETYEGPGRKSGHSLFFYDEWGWPAFHIALGWLKNRVTPETVIATAASHVAYLKTGAKAILPPLEIDPDEVQRLLDSVPVDYVIVEDLKFYDFARRYALPAIERYPERWKLVYALPGSEMQIFQRVRSPNENNPAL